MKRLAPFALCLITILGFGSYAAKSERLGLRMWLRMVKWSSGSSDATTVPIAMMGEHMQTTQRRALAAGDRERAEAIVAAARRVMERYRDVATAERDGYRQFAPHAPAIVAHFSSFRLTRLENRRADYDHPGSLLYRRTPEGWQIAGVMYAAPARATANDLNARAPLSIATWHRHVDFCVRTGDDDLRDPRFGFNGTIHTASACAAARGFWLPLAFGWMTHVYAEASDPRDVWRGAEMDEPGSPATQTPDMSKMRM